MGKKVIIFILIILVVVGLSYALSKNPNNEENNTIPEENLVQENQVPVENNTNITNTEENNSTTDTSESKDEKEEEPKQEENKEENETPVIIGKEEAESAAQETGKTEDQKAIELVTKQWGEEDKSVNYEIAHRNENIYIISVTDKQTTEVLAWYQVDMKTGEISQQ